MRIDIRHLTLFGSRIAAGPFVLTLFVTSIFGCRETALPELSAAQRVRPRCPVASADDFFFPPDAVFPLNARRDKFQRELASRFLTRTATPSLSCGDAVAEGYRLLWMPESASPTVITVTLVGTSWLLDATEFHDPRTSQAFTIARHVTRHVTDEQIPQLLDALERAHFWTRQPWRDSETNDAATWMIEGRRKTGYHVATMLDPVDVTFQDAALRFWFLAQLPIPPGANY
jgi:hypothetical protein